MAQYEAFEPAVEVQGRTILTVVNDALAKFSTGYQLLAIEVLAANGVEDPKPDERYPQQEWLNTFEAIAEELEPHILDRLGEQIRDVVEWPSGISSVEVGLNAIDEADQMNHRGGEIGFYRFDPLDERTREVTCKNSYPCPFDRGLIRAVAPWNVPVEAFVFVEELGDTCRRDGDDTGTYTASWKGFESGRTSLPVPVELF